MYFESEYASVDWNDDVKAGILTWKKFASGDDFRIPSSKALELALSKGAKKWFSDTSNAGVFSEEDRQWFNEEIVTKMLKNGINKSALIVPKSSLTQISLKKAAEVAMQIGLEIQYFSTQEEALDWLKD